MNYKVKWHDKDGKRHEDIFLTIEKRMEVYGTTLPSYVHCGKDTEWLVRRFLSHVPLGQFTVISRLPE